MLAPVTIDLKISQARELLLRTGVTNRYTAPMQSDPMEEWRRLTALYSEMGDLEIRHLAAQVDELTENAQGILRGELKKRGIAEGRSAQNAPSSASDSTRVQWDGREDSELDPEGDDSDHEALAYTWKTGLCRYDSMAEATQRCEMLRRAGIDCWIQQPGSQSFVRWMEQGTGDLQINVAADQLEQANTIIAQPIPQDIIKNWKELAEAPAYEMPRCPKCKAEDAILESVEPSNSWLCESCGYTWSDPVLDPASETEN